MNQKSKHIFNLEKTIENLRLHINRLEEKGVTQMSRELMELRTKFMKQKSKQNSLKKENAQWKRKLDEKTKRFDYEQENSSKYQKRIISQIFDRVNEQCNSTIKQSNKSLKTMEKKLSSLQNKVKQVQVKFNTQQAKLKYFKRNKRKNNNIKLQTNIQTGTNNKVIDIVLPQTPKIKIEDDGSESIIIPEDSKTYKKIHDDDKFYRTTPRRQHHRSMVHQLSMSELYNNLDYYLEEIEKRSITMKLLSSSSSNVSSIQLMNTSPIKKKKSPQRPSSASPIRRRKAKKLRKNRSRQQSSTTLNLKLKRKEYTTRYILNHRDNLGKGILAGGYYHVINSGNTL